MTRVLLKHRDEEIGRVVETGRRLNTFDRMSRLLVVLGIPQDAELAVFDEGFGEFVRVESVADLPGGDSVRVMWWS